MFDSEVDGYMPEVGAALDRHGVTGAARTDIYNRAYEAVMHAIHNTRESMQPPHAAIVPRGGQAVPRHSSVQLACGDCRRKGESICFYCARNGHGNDVDFYESPTRKKK